VHYAEQETKNMNVPPYSIVIPARYASTRFLGKPLHLLNGEPMIVHTARRAAESSATQVVVATDDERIAGVCAKAGVDVEMTREDHPSGTDRIAEVAKRLQWSADTIKHCARALNQQWITTIPIASRLSGISARWPCTSAAPLFQHNANHWFKKNPQLQTLLLLRACPIAGYMWESTRIVVIT